MAHQDRYGLTLSTSSAEAAAAYREGVDLLQAAWTGAAEAFEQAIAADPDFALAHIARARIHTFYQQGDVARQKAALARELVAKNGSERERSHVETLALAIEGQLPAALSSALAHIEAHPRDAIVMSLPMGAFGLFAFSGMADHDQARVDLCGRYAQHYGDDWWYVTNHGWALTENGDVKGGRAMTERGFAMRQANANAVHALLHAMFEDGSVEDADALVTRWIPTYDTQRHPARPYPLAPGARRARTWRCGPRAVDLCRRAAAVGHPRAAAQCRHRRRLAAVAPAGLWPRRARRLVGAGG